MSNVDYKIQEINEEFKRQLHLGIYKDYISIDDIANALEGNVVDDRVDIIFRWKNTIDNLNKNLNSNYQYPEELQLLLIDVSVDQISKVEKNNSSIDQICDVLETKTDNTYEFHDNVEEDEEDEEDDFSCLLSHNRVRNQEQPIQEVVYVETEKPKSNFWKNAAIYGATAYVSYKAGRKLGKSLM